MRALRIQVLGVSGSDQFNAYAIKIDTKERNVMYGAPKQAVYPIETPKMHVQSQLLTRRTGTAQTLALSAYGIRWKMNCKPILSTHTERE